MSLSLGYTRCHREEGSRYRLGTDSLDSIDGPYRFILASMHPLRSPPPELLWL